MNYYPAILCGLCAAFAGAAEPLTIPLDAREIVRRSDDLLRGEATYAKVTMEITRPEWKRELVLQAWTEGSEKFFTRVIEPKKDRGVGFLKRGREAWQYIPAIDRSLKIPPSMMLQSWMGSDFTNDEVVRADSLVTDYTHMIVAEDKETWTIELVPKEDAAVVWGKVSMVIRKDHFIGMRGEYYDEDGKAVKRFVTERVQEVEGKHVATRFTMHDLTRPGYSTALDYKDLTFKPKLAPDTFTLRNLRK